MRRNIVLPRVIFTALVLAWMLLIFSFSAQPGDESADVSGGVSYKLVTCAEKIVTLGACDWGEETRIAYATAIDHPVRKAAHMTEYGILACLAFFTFRAYRAAEKRRGIHFHRSILVAFLYACTDEFHQLYVPGRSGQFKDVLIDTCGAMLFLCILWGIRRLVQRGKKKA